MFNLLSAAIAVVSLLALAPVAVQAALIYDSGTLALPPSALTQNGVLTQSGVPSDWSTPPLFPGVDNSSDTFSYEAFSLPSSPLEYLQINFLDLSSTQSLFASAYLNSYAPDSSSSGRPLSVNYLGDQGFSGNPYGNPAAFQVVVPNAVSDHLVLVITDASGAPGGSGQQFSFLVEGFTDTSFHDSTVTPEPSPAALLFTAAGLAAIGRLRRRSAQSRQMSSSRS